MTDIPTWKQKLEQQYINLAFDPAALSDLSKKEASYLKKKKDEVTIRSSAAEYLTYVASVGGQQDSIEMRYEDENIWLTQRMMADRKSTRLNSSHRCTSRMPSSA